MKKNKICILIIIIIALTTLTTVNASDNITNEISNNDLIGINEVNEIIGSDDEYIYNNQNTKFTLEINNTQNYETNENITFNVHYNGTWNYRDSFEINPISIYKNNEKIGIIPINQINHTLYDTYGTIDATFTLKIENITHIKTTFSIWESNTIIIQKLTPMTFSSLNNNSIIIINNKTTYNSNNTWNNSIESLKKAISRAEENAEIKLNNVYIKTPISKNTTLTQQIYINKNLKIIGNNATINANENSHLFLINSNVTFINITFTNATSYFFINENSLTFINCTFADSYGRMINNTKDLNIINSTFKNMKAIYLHPNISCLENYYTETGIIYNAGNLHINNTIFNTFDYPKEIQLNNHTIKEQGLIYNLNNAIITNTNFTNMNIRAINNTGKIVIENSLFENIKTNSLKIIINTYNIISNNTIYQSYTGYREKENEETLKNKNYFLNGGAIYNSNKLIINNSKFNLITSHYGGAIYNEGNTTIINSNFTNTLSSGGLGGAIYNNNEMALENVNINKSTTTRVYMEIRIKVNDEITRLTYIDYWHGGAIYNNKTLYINNSIITKSSTMYGGAIANNGQLIINNTILDNNEAHYSNILGSYGDTLFNDEDGNCMIYNSIIKNTLNRISSIGGGGAFQFYMGTIYNMGNLLITRTIFDNITGIYEPLTAFTGTFTILNYGTLNATYNYFINSPHKVNPDKYIYYDRVIDDVYTYAFTNSIKNINMSNNYYCLNSDPYTIDTNFPVGDYFILTFENEYYTLDLNENKNITLKLKLASGKEFNNYELLPTIPVTINTYDENGNPINITRSLNNGKITIPYNYTSKKGSYIIKAEMGGGKCNTTIDVGKANATMNITKNNIYYTQNAVFKINMTAPTTPTGNITLKLNNTRYTGKLDENGNCIFNISNLTVGTYALKIVYEGDDDYFKIFYYDNYTVSKHPTNMTMSIPDVYYGNNGIITVKFNPTDITVYTYLYVNGEYDRQKMIRKSSTITLKNYATGKYNLTLYYNGDENYEACNASAVFIVKKFETNLTVSTSDIMAGETAYLNITLTPEGEVAGEANLTINSKTETIYLKNGNNTIKLENLTGGLYNITISFPGDKKYANSSANTVLNVKKHNTTMDVTVEEDKITVKVNPSNATGTVNLYINDQLQQLNLTDGTVTFTPNYNRFNNSIFVYYEGDNYYNYTTFNATYENNKLANLTGYDVLTYDGEAGTIYVTLTDERGYGIAGKNITITINNKKYTRVTNQSGIASLTLTLPIGNYTITSTYESYIVNNTFSVLKNINMTTVGDIEVYDNERFTYYVKLTDGRNNNIKNEEVTFTVNGQTYTNKTNNNGIARIFLTLNKGNYTITAKYKTENITNKINVRENDNYTITANDLEMYYRDGSAFNVTLKDGNGNTLSGRIITFTINNNTYQRTTDKNGVASLQINLAPGTYEIKTTYIGISTTNKILIKDYPVIITGEDVEMYYRDGTNYTVSLKDTRGIALTNVDVIFTVDGENYTRNTNKDGIASITINLPEGVYSITATYKNASTTNKIVVKDYAPVITGNDVEMYYRDGTNYTITLKNTKGAPLINVEVTFTIDNKNYTKTTNKEGIASITINLPEGVYSITATYRNVSTTNKIVVKDYAPVITGNDVEMYYRDGTNYTITLKNTKGAPLINVEVTFTIDGENYTRNTNKDGIASITINLPEGVYSITATYRNVSTTNKITVKDYEPVITGNDIEMHYRDGTNYTITLKNTQETPISNVDVIFTVDGENYTRATNKDGIASITINLPEGVYSITATYRNVSTTNKIIVKDYEPVITGSDVEMYYRDGTNYTITLKNTQRTPISNVDVIFNINNRNYTRITDSNGIARITINLPAGTYTIKATYKNASTTNKVTVKDYEPVITGNDVEMYYRDGTNYTITLKNTKGTVLSNRVVTFNINNRDYNRTTNSNGEASVTINLPEGTYTIKVTYKNATTTNKITVKEYAPVITGNDIEMYYRDGTNYTVTLKNSRGDILSNKVVTFNVDGYDYNRTTNSNGEASLTINLPAGTYNITATYKNTSTTNKILVKEYPPVLTTQDLEMYFHDNSTFKATLTNTNGDVLTNRKVTFTIGNETYTGTTNNQGVASIAINLAPGNYTIKTAYQNLTKTNNIEIRTNHNLETEDLIMTYKDGSRFKAKLTDKNGNALKNATILFTINGQPYTRTTNDEGIASIAINLNSGTHTITTRYQEEFKTNNITIKATVEANDVVKVYRNATQYYAKFTDNAGNVLKNTQVTFNINGVYYTRTTNESGVAKLNLNLQQGKYILTAINPVTGENAANNITILPTITENRDITKYYRNATQYTVKLIKPDGSIAGAGEKVTFNINGVYYERTANESGIAKMNINLNPGDYIITAEYAGCKVSNNIKVLPTIKAQDLTKKYGISSPFTATLLDGTGKALANEKISFNINGVFYTRTTNDDGIAKLNINLQAGKYIITSSYNGLNVANTVTVQN